MSVKSLSLSLESFQSSVKQRSPNLSPLSKMKHYQKQIFQAHNFIDQLEQVIDNQSQVSEKENMDYNLASSTRIPKLKIHQKILSLKLNSEELDNIEIKSFITPRESGRQQPFSPGDSLKLPKALYELQQLHSLVISETKNHQESKKSKIQELKELINIIESEIRSAQDQQDFLLNQTDSVQRDMDSVNCEIDAAQEYLEKSKYIDKIDQLKGFIKQNDESQTVKSERRFHKNSCKSHQLKNNRKLLEKFNQLKNKISQVHQSNIVYQQMHDIKIMDLQNQLQEIKISHNKKGYKTSPIQLIAKKTPGKTNVRIIEGEEYMQLRIDDTSQRFTSSKRETMENLRLKTESDAYLYHPQSSIQSVKSFRSDISQKTEKRRDCALCSIF